MSTKSESLPRTKGHKKLTDTERILLSYRRNAEKIGLRQEDLGRRFNWARRWVTVIGHDDKFKMFCVTVADQNGKKLQMHPKVVAKILRKLDETNQIPFTKLDHEREAIERRSNHA